MKTKEKVLALLKTNGNAYISGQEIAEALFLTRAAVWKAIKALREDGHEIDALNNKGYCLKLPSEPILTDKICEYLDAAPFMPDIYGYDEVTSTNDVAREIYYSGERHDFVVIADTQTKGRGRHGRVFLSPKGTGLYMTLLVVPKAQVAEGSLLVAMTAVAVSEAIEEVLGLKTNIKWVNDIFYQDRKVAGILTEVISSYEAQTIECAMVGIGINLYEPEGGFPEEIKKKAGALLSAYDAQKFVKNELSAAIIRRFWAYYLARDKSFINEYRNRSNILGHYVKVEPVGMTDDSKDYKGYALACEIDDECHLIVEYENGKKATLTSGEVSVVKY